MGRGHIVSPVLVMTDRQRSILTQESRKRTTQRQYHDRIMILLYSQEGKSCNWIAAHLNIAYNTVKSWGRRWVADYSTLLNFEKGKDGQGVSDGELLESMLERVRDLPRSGAPARITLAQKEQIIAIACERPDTYGIQMTDWTHEMLVKVVISQGIVDTISRRHLGGILKNEPVTTS